MALYGKIGVGAKVEVTTNRFPSALVQGPGDPSPVQKLTMVPKPPATVTPTGQTGPVPAATPIPAVSATARTQRRG